MMMMIVFEFCKRTNNRIWYIVSSMIRDELMIHNTANYDNETSYLQAEEVADDDDCVWVL